MNTNWSQYGLSIKKVLPTIALATISCGWISETLANTLKPNCERTCGEQKIPIPQWELSRYFNKPRELQSVPNNDEVTEGWSCKWIEIEWCPVEEKVLKILEPEALS